MIEQILVGPRENEEGEGMEGVPGDLPVVRRNAVRLVVLDDRGQVLLFRTRDPVRPEVGLWWELPGGGTDPGETYVDTAIRELREETGFVVGPDRVGAPTWRRQATFRHRQRRHVQDEVVMTVRLDGVAPAIDESQRMDYETEDYIDFAWWPVADVVASRDRFYPGRLPGLITAFLAGESIDEPFEFWS
jgi:8-oxo-dGTP pyrophosphatase MutT (NUDIX family)